MSIRRNVFASVSVLSLAVALSACSSGWDYGSGTAGETTKPQVTSPAPVPSPDETEKPEPTTKPSPTSEATPSQEPTPDPAPTEEGLVESGSAFDMKVGDCINMPKDENFTDVEYVSCDQLHDAEVYLNYDASGDTTFPGFDAIYEEAEVTCAKEFKTYVGSDPETSIYYFNYFTPIEEGWADGDRSVTCLAYKVNAAGNDLVPMTGSVKGSGQ